MALGKTTLDRGKARISCKPQKPSRKNKKDWQRQGFGSYVEWFQMRNRVWKTIWKERDNA